MVTARLHDLPERETGDVGELASVEARVEAPARQIGVGLRATFVLANAGDQPAELMNPLDLLQWQLLDEAGAPLALPSRPPNLRVHRPTSETWKLDSAVPIVEVSRGGERTNAAVLDSPSVKLAPRADLAVTFEFDRILQGGTAVELPSGDYRLVCIATIIDATDTQRSRILGCDPLAIRFDRA